MEMKEKTDYKSKCIKLDGTLYKCLECDKILTNSKHFRKHWLVKH